MLLVLLTLLSSSATGAVSVRPTSASVLEAAAVSPSPSEANFVDDFFLSSFGELSFLPLNEPNLMLTFLSDFYRAGVN